MMKQPLNTRWVVLILAAAGVGFFASSMKAQDKKASDKDKPVSPEKKEDKDTPGAMNDGKNKQHDQAGLDEWMKMAAAGEHHKKLDMLVGTWNLSVKFSGEGMTESKGTSEFKWVMEGRFLIETTKTDMSGHLFEWMGWHGYDNRKKQYFSVWADNFDTGIETMTGQFDDAKKTLTYVGETDNPEKGGKVKVRWIMHLESKDRFKAEMYEGAGNGKDEKVMEVVATRG